MNIELIIVAAIGDGGASGGLSEWANMMGAEEPDLRHIRGTSGAGQETSKLRCFKYSRSV